MKKESIIMAYLQKTWIRIVISLIASSMLLQFVALSSTDPNYKHTRGPGSLTLLVIAVIFYLLLTAYVKRRVRNDQG